MGDGEPGSASPTAPQVVPDQAEQLQQLQQATSASAEAEPASVADVRASPPAASTSDTEAQIPERVGSLVVRPVAQRISGPEASPGPLSPSGSLAEPSSGQPIVWAPRKSAWSPYRPSAGSLPIPAPPRTEDSAPEPSDAGRAIASSAGGSPAPQLKPQPPPVSLPVQNSLEMLHDAAVSAAEGFLRQDSPEVQAALAAPREAVAERREAAVAAEEEQDQGHRFFTGTAGGASGQMPKEAMETLQAAASELFRRFNEVAGSSQAGEVASLQMAKSSSEGAPLGFGSRLPSMAGSSPTAAGGFLEALRAASSAAAASGQSNPFAWQQPQLPMPMFSSAEQQPALQGTSGSGAGTAAQDQSGERTPKRWAEAAATLLGPVGPRLPLTSAFSEALASRGGQLQSMAVPQSQMAPVSMPPRQHSGQDWATARLGSAGSESSFSLPLTAWRLGSGPEGLKLTGSLPTSAGMEGSGFFKAPGPLSVRAGTHNLPSLTMPGTPSITNMPSRSSLSPPLSPQHNQEGMLSPLGRQLEVCLARQVQLQNAKRNAPTAAFVTEDPSSGVPVINPRMTGFGPLPWPHTSQHSLDSQVSRTQLAQRVVDRADFFKVPGNLASFLKQASLDSAMAALQQREATPPTPHARQLPSGAGSVWPFGMVSSFRAGGAGPTAQLDSPPQRLNTLTLQSPLLRSQLGSLAAEHPTQRLQTSQQVFGDFGAAPGAPMGDAQLADSLYASVARQLQSGAGPAAFPQAQHQSLQAAAEEAAAAGGGFYRLDSGAALAAHGLGGGNPYGDLQQQANMLELLGLLRAGLAGQGAVAEVQPGNAPKRKRRHESPAGGGRRGRDDAGEAEAGAAPAPKRSANNKCEECGTTETPTWRRWGPTLLCNACGLRRKKSPRSAAARQQQPPAAAPVAGYGQPAWVAGPEAGSSLGQLADSGGAASQQ